MASFLVRRDGYWRFARRVPKEYTHLDQRGIVQQSTKIRIADDPRCIRAGEVARRLNAGLEAYWQGLADGNTGAALRDYEAARATARKLGMAPPIEDASGRTIAELLDRIEKLSGDRAEDRASVLAVYDAAPMPAVTFRQCAKQFIESHGPSWSNSKHAGQWNATLEAYAYPVLGELAASQISDAYGTDLVLKVLQPIWYAKTETASRLRGRIEQILDWAKVRGYRSGENPARWKGHLDKLLPSKSKIAPVKHHAAMPYADVPAFIRDLRKQPGIAARALEFTILTAARTSEVIGAKPGEIDKAARMWTVPASRMKGRREHRVPLSGAAMAIIDGSPNDEYLFPGRKSGKPLSNMAMLNLLDRMGMRDQAVTHGFRSTFRDWGAETGNYPNELLEMAIAHVVGDKVEAAYRRGDQLTKRHQLMADWESFCSGTRRQQRRGQARA
ncbi:MAG: site-specific integrase [Xanthobacteraceae bacterium]